jgi:hypothetical protein
MSRVVLDPPTFSLVDFDPDEIIAIIEGLLDDIGLDGPVTLEVDQTTPLGMASVRSVEPLMLFVESGALEDPRKLRGLSSSGARNVLGRLLFRANDRLDPAFGEPPDDDQLPLELSTAWDVYCAGRLVRLGHHHFDERQRRLYQFRTRHGFTDSADAAFGRLWDGEGLTWADIEGISASATAAA